MNLMRHRLTPPELNITPLIDVVFLLLIFFMVSTTFDRPTKITLELPESSAEEQSEEQERLELTIDAQGRYYVNQEEVINTRIETLKWALQSAANGNQDLPLIISADGKTPHQAVITAMDAAGQLGFTQLSFTTKPTEGEQ